jgi:orotidine-5'-phosphate decarboxylase
VTPRERLIVALDAPSVARARELSSTLAGAVGWLKVGAALFAAGGPDFVRELARSFHVFLDLKLHDIPHQVGEATRAVANLGAELLTVHSAGGRAMLEASVAAAAGSKLRVLGVTVLTSLDRQGLEEVGILRDPADLVLERGRLVLACGLAGCVASPQEARQLRRELGHGFELVTPGVRRPEDARHDQARTATPGEALAAGATRLVVGRPITEAPDPIEAARGFLAELE